MLIAVILLLLCGIAVVCCYLLTRGPKTPQFTRYISSDNFKPEGPDYVPPKSSGVPVYVFIDVETTGLSSDEDAIVQISAIRYFGDKAIDGMNTYINPSHPIPAKATSIHGITDIMVKDAPVISQIQKPFLDFIDGAVLIGYNALFDLKFLDKAFNGALDGVQYVDVLKISRSMLDLPNYRLETVANYLGFSTKDGFHNSLVDCRATATVFFELDLQSYSNQPNTFYSRERTASSRNEDVNLPYFSDQAYEDWSTGERVRIDGNVEEALALFDKAIDAGFTLPCIYESYAKAYRKLKDYDREIEILDEAIQKFEGHHVVEMFEHRKKRTIELLNSQQRKEEELRQKALKKEQKAEQRRLKEELAKAKPKNPIGRAVAQCDDNGVVIKVFDSVSAASKEVGVDTKGIRSAATGKQKHSGGFCWKYVDADDTNADNKDSDATEYRCS